MKTIVSYAVAITIAFMAIPHLKNETKEIPPIKRPTYDLKINKKIHQLQNEKLKTDSLRIGVGKTQQYIRNVVPGAD